MILFPAIDLKDGECVRLYKGEMDQATVFNHNPAAQAREFEEYGARWIHVVDLNGAFEGRPVNEKAVTQIVNSVQVPVQLGGGIRDMRMIDQWLGAGVARVILGTVAVKDPLLVKQACKRHPGRIVVGIDARAGMVAVEGWAEASTLSVVELARKFEDCGVAAIIYTDISRDGTLEGPNIPSTVALAKAVNIPVIASGGVGSIEDLQAIKASEDEGIAGVICGRAIYDGQVNLPEAIALLQES
jgi:phosphoribosylformimino-5-aminoimidazole carboxamide ribotide isomerase